VVSHGTNLLRLFADWAHGATIVAGTAVLAADPVRPGPRVAQACSDCSTWTFGVDDTEAFDRLTDHRRRCHAQ
jgi:hypothetical protein